MIDDDLWDLMAKRYKHLEQEKINTVRDSSNGYEIGYACGKLKNMDELMNLLRIPYGHYQRQDSSKSESSRRDV